MNRHPTRTKPTTSLIHGAALALALAFGVVTTSACDTPEAGIPVPSINPAPSVDVFGARTPSESITGVCNKKHKDNKSECEADADCEWLISNGRGYCIEKEGLPVVK